MFLHLLTIICFGLAFSEAARIFSLPSYVYNATQKDIYLQKIESAPNNGIKPHYELSIVNGQKAVRGQFCYQVYLQFSDGKSLWSCGGSLVTNTTILTAGHCVNGAKSAVVVLGALDLSLATEPGRVIAKVTSSGLTVHENYSTVNYYNDIALVKMKKAVTLNNYVCTISLPDCNETGESNGSSDQYTISGWGKTSDRTTTSILMYMNVSGEALTTCASYFKLYAAYNVITTQLCTSGTGGKSTCNGDSGGPLVASGVQRGIVSLGMSSCQTGAASVYTDLTYFMTWLCPKL